MLCTRINVTDRMACDLRISNNDTIDNAEDNALPMDMKLISATCSRLVLRPYFITIDYLCYYLWLPWPAVTMQARDSLFIKMYCEVLITQRN